MNRRSISTWLTVLVAVGLVWWFILPPALGGRTTLFVTHGVSMEPAIHEGDLALLHKKRSYQVGDVVAYKAKSINAITLHRIITDNGDGTFTTRGDANPEADLDHPSTDEFYGTMDHLFEGSGGIVKIITSWPVRIIGLGLIAWSLWGVFVGRKVELEEDDSPGTFRRLTGRVASRRLTQEDLPGTINTSDHQATAADAAASGVSAPSYTPRWSKYTSYGMQGAAALVAALALLVLVTTASKSSVTKGEQKILYSMKGNFNYTGQSKPGGEIIYKDGKVRNGDPVYLSLVDNLDLAYDFNFSSMAKFVGTGSYTVETSIQGASGWKHTISSTTPAIFPGTEVETTSNFDLAQLRDISRQVSALTRVVDGSYQATINVNIHLEGKLGNQDFKADFPVALNFTADANIMRVAPSTVSPELVAQPGSGDPAPAILDGLTPSKSDTLTIPKGTENKLSVAGHDMTVGGLRKIVYGVLFGALVMFLLGSALGRKRFEPKVQDISTDMLDEIANLLGNPRPEPSSAERFGLVDADGQPIDVVPVTEAVAETAPEVTGPVVEDVVEEVVAPAEPSLTLKTAPKAPPRRTPKPKVQAPVEDDEDTEDEVVKPKAKKPAAKRAPKKPVVSDDVENSEED